MDRRLTPANGRVAARRLSGLVAAESFVDGTTMSVCRTVADIRSAPMGPRERQLLLGARVTVFEIYNDWAFVEASDGYVGYIKAQDLSSVTHPTYGVSTFATHAFEKEDFKSRDVISLPFGARLQVLDERRKFFETPFGYVPKSHLRPLDQLFSDPATLAQMHFGVPYLWGGNSTLGIDCSGLVSSSLRPCGIECPADSDMQLEHLGHAVAAADQRGDLVFWTGHVGMMVDEETLIHANAHHMAVRYEPLQQAILRIDAQGGGYPLAYKRLAI